MAMIKLVTQGLDLVVPQILIESHHPVDDAPRTELDYPVCYGVDKLMVMAGKQDYPGKVDQGIVQGSDGLKVQMIGWLVQDQAIACLQHYP